ncbi:MAG: succinate--CoA ligase subunit alpha [Nitrososphaerales archaeon]
MAILIDAKTRVLVQGATGREGSTHTASMLNYGTKILAGVTPNRGGSTVSGVPIYDLVSEAVESHPEINTSIVFVPASAAPEAVYEAIDAGIKLIIIVTERIPIHDTINLVAHAERKGAKIIGPNCPGVITPEVAKVGIMPAHLFKKGRVGIVSRSGTLTYEVAWALTRSGFGQSTAVGIGGDPVVGLGFVDVVQMFEADPETDAIVVIGEIGGDAEERLAAYIRRQGLAKPIVAYIAGRSAPKGKRMGHAGAIISLGSGSAEEKRAALIDAGVNVAELPSQIPILLKKAIQRRA